MKMIRIAFGIAAFSAVFSACTPKDKKTPDTVPMSEAVSFNKSIRPILSNKCTICHNAEVLPDRPWFESSEAALKSGMIVPGKPDSSRILTVITENPDAEKAMPPVSHRLSQEEITLLRTWISEGASWPAGKAGHVKPAFIPRE